MMDAAWAAPSLGRPVNGAAGMAVAAPQQHPSPYFQVALYACGNVLALGVVALLWWCWGVLSAFQEPLLWAYLCSLSLRDVKGYVTDVARRELEASNLVVCIAKLLLLPLVIVYELYQEVAGQVAAKYAEFQAAQLAIGQQAKLAAATPAAPGRAFSTVSTLEGAKSHRLGPGGLSGEVEGSQASSDTGSGAGSGSDTETAAAPLRTPGAAGGRGAGGGAVASSSARRAASGQLTQRRPRRPSGQLSQQLDSWCSTGVASPTTPTPFAAVAASRGGATPGGAGAAAGVEGTPRTRRRPSMLRPQRSRRPRQQAMLAQVQRRLSRLQRQLWRRLRWWWFWVREVAAFVLLGSRRGAAGSTRASSPTPGPAAAGTAAATPQQRHMGSSTGGGGAFAAVMDMRRAFSAELAGASLAAPAGVPPPEALAAAAAAAGAAAAGAAGGAGGSPPGPSPSRPLFTWLLRCIVLWEGYAQAKAFWEADKSLVLVLLLGGGGLALAVGLPFLSTPSWLMEEEEDEWAEEVWGDVGGWASDGGGLVAEGEESGGEEVWGAGVWQGGGVSGPGSASAGRSSSAEAPRSSVEAVAGSPTQVGAAGAASAFAAAAAAAAAAGTTPLGPAADGSAAAAAAASRSLDGVSGSGGGGAGGRSSAGHTNQAGMAAAAAGANGARAPLPCFSPVASPRASARGGSAGGALMGSHRSGRRSHAAHRAGAAAAARRGLHTGVKSAARAFRWLDARARATCVSYLPAAVSALIVVGLLVGSVLLSAVLVVQVGEESRAAVASLNGMLRSRQGRLTGVWLLMQGYERDVTTLLQGALPKLADVAEERATQWLVQHKLTRLLRDVESLRGALRLPANCGTQAMERLSVAAARAALAAEATRGERDGLAAQVRMAKEEVDTLVARWEAAWLSQQQEQARRAARRLTPASAALAEVSDGGGGGASADSSAGCGAGMELGVGDRRLQQAGSVPWRWLGQQQVKGGAAAEAEAPAGTHQRQLQTGPAAPQPERACCAAAAGNASSCGNPPGACSIAAAGGGRESQLPLQPGQQREQEQQCMAGPACPAPADTQQPGSPSESPPPPLPAPPPLPCAAFGSDAGAGGSSSNAPSSGGAASRPGLAALFGAAAAGSSGAGGSHASTAAAAAAAAGVPAQLSGQLVAAKERLLVLQEQLNGAEKAHEAASDELLLVERRLLNCQQQATAQQQAAVAAQHQHQHAQQHAAHNHHQHHPGSRSGTGGGGTPPAAAEALVHQLSRSGRRVLAALQAWDFRAAGRELSSLLVGSSGGGGGARAPGGGGGSSSSAGGGSSTPGGHGLAMLPGLGALLGSGAGVASALGALAHPLASAAGSVGGQVVGTLSSTTAVALGTSLGVLRLGLGVAKFLVQVAVFASVLYALLALDIDPVSQLMKLVPVSRAQQAVAAAAVTDAFRGVFVGALKLAVFHAGFTLITLRAFGAHFVFLASAISAVVAILPLVPVCLVALPAVLELALLRGEAVKAVLLAALHLGAYLLGDDLIFREIEPTLPYLTTLGVFGGMYTFSNPLQGVLLGPMLLALLRGFYMIHARSSWHS